MQGKGIGVSFVYLKNSICNDINWKTRKAAPPTVHINVENVLGSAEWKGKKLENGKSEMRFISRSRKSKQIENELSEQNEPTSVHESVSVYQRACTSHHKGEDEARAKESQRRRRKKILDAKTISIIFMRLNHLIKSFSVAIRFFDSISHSLYFAVLANTNAMARWIFNSILSRTEAKQQSKRVNNENTRRKKWIEVGALTVYSRTSIQPTSHQSIARSCGSNCCYFCLCVCVWFHLCFSLWWLDNTFWLVTRSTFHYAI